MHVDMTEVEPDASKAKDKRPKWLRSLSVKANRMADRMPTLARLRKGLHAAVPPDLRRSRLGKLVFVLVALGACGFGLYQMYGLFHKFLSFEPDTVVSVLTKDPPVNFSLHIRYDPSSQDGMDDDFVPYFISYLSEELGLAVTAAEGVDPSMAYSALARNLNYYRTDELCVPSLDQQMADDFYLNRTFDYKGDAIQSYLSDLKKSIQEERLYNITIGGHSLETFPWVHYMEKFVGFYLKDLHNYTAGSSSKGCGNDEVAWTVKDEGIFYFRITYMLPKLSCLPFWINLYDVDDIRDTYLSGGTASTQPSAGPRLRASMADTAHLIEPDFRYQFIAHIDATKRQNRYCNKNLHAENNCPLDCFRKEISEADELANRKSYYDALYPRAFYRLPNDHVFRNRFHMENICNIKNQEALAKVGVGKEFHEKKLAVKRNCEKHCTACTACRMACSETRVTLHFPDVKRPLQPKWVYTSDGRRRRLVNTISIEASSEEILLTEFKLGYTFQLFASDVGGTVKLSATIIGCVSIAAVLYKCIMMRRKAKAEGNTEEVKEVQKKATEAVMGIFA